MKDRKEEEREELRFTLRPKSISHSRDLVRREKKRRRRNRPFKSSISLSGEDEDPFGSRLIKAVRSVGKGKKRGEDF